MAVVFAENVIEVAVIGTYAGRPTANVLHIGSEEGVNASDADAVLDFANNWQDHIVPLQTGAYTLLNFEWRSLDPADSNVGTLPPVAGKPINGAAAASVGAVPSVAYLIRKNTANRPRGRSDGRIYLPGVPEDQVDNAGVLSSAQRNNVVTGIDAFYAGVTDNPIGSDVNRWLVVLETTPLSRAPGTQSVTVGSRRVTSLTVDQKVATQRRRLR
jgi:hypothetical protein